MELVNIIEKDGEQLVSGRELHNFLGIETPYTMWFKRMCEYDFVEFEDFITKMLESTGGRPQEENLLKLDMAKELAMLARNEKGKQIRKYFIEIEKAWNSPDKVMARALQIANRQLEDYRQQILDYKPKVDFYNSIIDSKDTIGMGELAKTLNIKGFGRNKLFEFLREKCILDRKNIPYQTYCDRGYFRTIETTYTKGADTKIYIKTVVFQKGVDYIRKLVLENE